MLTNSKAVNILRDAVSRGSLLEEADREWDRSCLVVEFELEDLVEHIRRDRDTVYVQNLCYRETKEEIGRTSWG